MHAVDLKDPNWWPHRYDPNRDAVHFIKVTRDQHRQAAFLTDEYLPSAQNPLTFPRPTISDTISAPLHFIFHSAYCCSTLLARAFDLDGVSMGLKEPVILNDLAGIHMRGATLQQLAAPIETSLKLLARPFSAGEAVIVKPSNVINALAPALLNSSPSSKAIFLYAPLKDFLGSIARKGMFGRLWVRDLMVKQLATNMIDLGLQGNDYLQLTDLQAAAVGWLAQHAFFNSLIHTMPSGRLVTLNSETFMGAQAETMEKLAAHFALKLSPEQRGALIQHPAFSSHSKFGERFDAQSREQLKLQGIEQHADEIEKVTIWAEAVANNVGLSLDLPTPL